MKKFVSILMAMVMILCMTAAAETVTTTGTTASAGAVSSKTTTDNTVVEKIESVSGVEVEETFAIVVTEDKAPVVKEITNLYTYVAEEKKAPITYFPEETKVKVMEALIAKLLKAEEPKDAEAPAAPLGAVESTGAATLEELTKNTAPEVLEKLPDIEKLEINEFITVEPIEYKEEYGDIKTNFTFVTEYKQEQQVIVLFGLYSGEVDEFGEFVVEWVVLDALVEEDGSLSVVIPQAEMLKMQDSLGVAMAVLSEKVDLDELDDLSALTELTEAK